MNNSKRVKCYVKNGRSLKWCLLNDINTEKEFISTLWASKFSTRLILSLLMGMIKHSQITQSNKFAISLQYLKKEVRSRGHFWHADQRQSFYKLVLSFLMEVARHVQNTQNRKLVIFLQYIKKNCCNCFVFYFDAKHSDILPGFSHVHCYLLSTNCLPLFSCTRTIFVFCFPKYLGKFWI